MTIQMLLVCGFVAGVLVGVSVTKPRLGCTILLAVPVAMICYVAWWQGENPDKLRSTSSLDFMFGALWPSLAALGGYYAGQTLRWHFGKR